MILQLLFDLQARLRTGLAAGGMILLSDPRLPELQKKVGVLAAKSPVFQRLSNLLQSLADDRVVCGPAVGNVVTVGSAADHPGRLESGRRR